MGFTEILTIIFVLLKVFGVISWSWWLVFFAGNHRRCLLHHHGYRKRNGYE